MPYITDTRGRYMVHRNSCISNIYLNISTRICQNSRTDTIAVCKIMNKEAVCAVGAHIVNCCSFRPHIVHIISVQIGTDFSVIIVIFIAVVCMEHAIAINRWSPQVGVEILGFSGPS